MASAKQIAARKKFLALIKAKNAKKKGTTKSKKKTTTKKKKK